MNALIIPAMLILSAVMMSMAWLGQLRFRDSWSFWTALVLSWMLVLPEYVLNTAATCMGQGQWSGAQMAAIHLATGAICVALVSRSVLGEMLSLQQWLGFGLMVVAIFLNVGK
jgi:uncharacterized protein (DUF486 family)